MVGWRGSQILVVSVGLLLGLGLLRGIGGSLGPGLGIAVVGLAVVLVAWPIAGRTVEEWTPVVLSYALETLLSGSPGRRQRVDPRELVSANALGSDRLGLALSRQGGSFRHLAASRLSRARPAGRSPSGEGAPRAPRLMRAFSLETIALPQSQPFGAIRDRRTGNWTVVLAVEGSGGALAGTDELDRGVAAWSAVLAALSRELAGISHLQWVLQSFPDEGRSRRAYFEQFRGPGGPACEAYREVLAATERACLRHELLVALSVPGRRGATVSRDGVPPRGLVAGAVSLERLLVHAGFEVRGVLSPAALAAAIASPVHSVAEHATARGHRGAVAWPWPVAVAEHWSYLVVDGTFQAGFWVVEWPRNPVEGGFLFPLLLESTVRRRIGLVLEPVAPLRAVRRVEHDRTSQAADAELRHRHGFAQSERLRAQQEAVIRREGELAAGHGAYRFTGLVSVVEDTREELEIACTKIEQAAALSMLEIRRLYGAQAATYLALLPLGRGLL